MSTVLVKELINAGVHFGHRTSRWNPKMGPYIHGRRNLIHIIDLRETVRGLLRAKRYLTKLVSQGSLVLFVGTKRQAADTIEREAQRCQMPYVCERWLGGTLTNFSTIRSRLRRLEELERFETTGALESYSKKMQSSLMRERRKIFRNLAGIREMNRLPSALVVVDPRYEHISVKEARKLGLTTLALVDTDCDPDLVDLPIPGNDDSIRSIELIISQMADAVIEGRANLPVEPPKGQSSEPKPRPRRAEKVAPQAAVEPPLDEGEPNHSGAREAGKGIPSHAEGS